MVIEPRTIVRYLATLLVAIAAVWVLWAVFFNKPNEEEAVNHQLDALCSVVNKNSDETSLESMGKMRGLEKLLSADCVLELGSIHSMLEGDFSADQLAAMGLQLRNRFSRIRTAADNRKIRFEEDIAYVDFQGSFDGDGKIVAADVTAVLRKKDKTWRFIRFKSRAAME